jgi:nucleotide-binding universal stress UspA family protein
VVGGSPADALLAAAEGVDLLAVGSRGLSPLAAVFLGSTAERLAGKSPRPVLVVRRRGEARGLLGAIFS